MLVQILDHGYLTISHNSSGKEILLAIPFTGENLKLGEGKEFACGQRAPKWQNQGLYSGLPDPRSCALSTAPRGLLEVS